MRKVLFITTILLVVWMEVDRAESGTPQAFTPTYGTELKRIARTIGVEPTWLDAVIAFESNRNPKAVNQLSGAVGLIQFLPSTARNLGTTSTDLAAMDTVSQMVYVEQYLLPFSGKLKDKTDLYLAVFFPKAIGKDDRWVLKSNFLTASRIASHNKGFDLNKDGILTVGEIRTKIE